MSSDERSLEDRALRISELSGELVAQAARGEEAGMRHITLTEIRRHLEALDAQATRLAVKLNQELQED